VNAVDGAVIAPALKVSVHGFPRREISWQLPSRTTCSKQIQDGVDHLSKIDPARASSSFASLRLNEVWGNQIPLVASQIRRIAIACVATLAMSFRR
jgi:hypothetical protein